MNNESLDLQKIDVENEIKRQLEFSIEEEKLKETINIISDEILKYIGKRKDITEYIVEYRKKYIEDYRDDDDKLIEYFDHEKFVKEDAFRTIDRRLKELTVLKTAPYFGSVDFSEIDFGIDKIYIGRFGVTPDGSYEPVVVDWRAPIASLFYTGSLGEAAYEAPMGKVDVNILSKRQFVIKNENLKGMFDSALDVKDEILQMVLSRNAGEKLKDIIMTIQKEQDDLIRQPRNKTIVVDGVAGSGKTTIALHRIAYLLYNHRKTLEDKVLILGPNNIFMEYISTVLPSLGETGIKQTTFRDMALDILHINNIIGFKDYMEEILSGNEELIKEIIHKNSLEYKEELDKLINELDSSLIQSRDLLFRNKVVITDKEIEEMLHHHYKYMPLFRRTKKIKRILYSKIKDVRDEEYRQIQKEYQETIKSLSQHELELEINSIEFDRRNKIRELISEIIEFKKSLTWLNSSSCLDLYEEFNGNKDLMEHDLAAILYLKIKLEGAKLNEEIKHVVIDEAQDYSSLQFWVVKELTKCTSLTIVGDSNQRLIPLNGRVPMLNIEEVLESCDIEHFKLNKSYRSTSEIMSYANKYLQDTSIVPLVRNGEEIVYKDVLNEYQLAESVTEMLNDMRKKEYESIAIICRDMEDTETIAKLLESKVSLKVINKENVVYNKGIVVLPSYFAKGLEFDAAIIIEGKQNELGNNEYCQEDKLKYVMATRALHELCVIHNR